MDEQGFPSPKYFKFCPCGAKFRIDSPLVRDHVMRVDHVMEARVNQLE
jgi:hypothetical protein